MNDKVEAGNKITFVIIDSRTGRILGFDGAGSPAFVRATGERLEATILAQDMADVILEATYADHFVVSLSIARDLGADIKFE